MMDRWRPLALRAHMSARAIEEMDRLAEESLADRPLRAWRRLPAEEMSWLPPMELYAKDDKFVVRTEVPGVKKDDIDISVTGGMLTIKGERKVSKEVKEEECHRCEFCYGSFSRSIHMPTAVEILGIEAHLEDGVLEISLPKALEVTASKVQVKIKGG